MADFSVTRGRSHHQGITAGIVLDQGRILAIVVSRYHQVPTLSKSVQKFFVFSFKESTLK